MDHRTGWERKARRSEQGPAACSGDTERGGEMRRVQEMEGWCVRRVWLGQEGPLQVRAGGL